MSNGTEDPLDYYNRIVEPLYAELLTRQSGKKLNDISPNAAKGFEAHAAALRRSGEERQRDMEDARRYFTDTGLDIARALAVDLSAEANTLFADRKRVKWCAHAPRTTVSNNYEAAINMLAQAAQKDNNVTLNDRERALQLYSQAAKLFKEWIALFDPERMNEFRYFDFTHQVKKQIAGFITGVAASAVVAVLAWLYLPTGSPIQAAPATPNDKAADRR